MSTKDIAEEAEERWCALSQDTQIAMRELGHFRITHSGETVKGCGTFGSDEPGKCYWDAKDLRGYAKAMLEVADLLDELRRWKQD